MSGAAKKVRVCHVDTYQHEKCSLLSVVWKTKQLARQARQIMLSMHMLDMSPTDKIYCWVVAHDSFCVFVHAGAHSPISSVILQPALCHCL